MSTKDYRTRDDIVITVKGKARAEVDASAKKKKGSVPVGKTPKRFLKRRTKESAGSATFYDLGYMRNGSSGLYDNMSPMTPGTNVDDAIYASLVGTLLLRGVANAKALDPLIPAWAGYFTANGFVPYQLSVTAGETTYYNRASLYAPGHPQRDTDKWTSSGLKLTAADVAAAPFIITQLDRSAILVPDPGDPITKNKITAVNNFAAAAVPFTPSRGMKVFVVPALGVLTRESRALNYPLAGGEVALDVVINPVIATKPPQSYDPTSPFYGSPINVRWERGNNIFGAPVFYHSTWDAANSGIPGYESPSIFAASSYWPIPPGDPYINGRTQGMSAMHGLGPGFGGTDTSVNQLLFIIQQDGSTFYVWDM